MKKALLTILTLCLSLLSNAQTDSTSKSTFIEKYNYITRAKEEKLQLWKIYPLNNFAFGGGPEKFFFSKIYFGYERKLNPKFSINSELGLHVYYDNTLIGNKVIITPSGSIGTRYYYNMQRRISKGKAANNMSGDYFTLNVNFAKPTYLEENLFPVNTNYIRPDNSISLLYGIQRRATKYFLFDFSFGGMYMPTSNHRVSFEMNLRIGLGL